MKKVLLGLVVGLGFSSFTNAEFVTNSKGEQIELKSNGTWVKQSVLGTSNQSNPYEINQSDLISSEKIITTNPSILVKKMKNGDDQDVEVKISFMVGVPENIKSFDLKKTNSMIVTAIDNTKSILKNPYSFVPRRIQILDSSSTLWYVVVEYTAKNSYGADVAGKRMFKFDQTGKIIGAV